MNKGPFCEEYRILKRDFDKDTAEDSRYTTKLRVTIRAVCYVEGHKGGYSDFGTHELNICPVCGKEIKGEEKNEKNRA